ncbi:hypothetical protein HMPREF1870_00966 [Bacteroidales bacterium KA00344]|nr:hypothetical protein HMPREF1870_00966 [Bacteroidales bacterium KA00344]
MTDMLSAMVTTNQSHPQEFAAQRGDAQGKTAQSEQPISVAGLCYNRIKIISIMVLNKFPL